MSETYPTLTEFTPGDLVISVSGDGNDSGTYGDNQASPITLEEITPEGEIVGELVLPQEPTAVDGTTEYAISGEYGSSSEGSLALAANGESLVIAGYGVNAATFNAGGAAVYGTAALAQSTSETGGAYTAVPRVIADISYNTTIDTSTALYNVFNTNNPRSVATVNGTSFYISGQGVDGDTTQGVFVAEDGASSATSIDDTSDTRTAEIVNGELYVSRDSKQAGGGSIGSYGTTLPTGTTTATDLVGIGPTVTLTAGEQTNGINAVGQTVNLSPENYFFANATTLYVADGGDPKEGGLGDGGLQKWTLSNGTWTLDYTLSAGLNLVPDTDTDGTSGLIGLTGTVESNGQVELFATNETIADLDQTYLYEITDTLSATTLPTDESFTPIVTAAADTNIRGISFAPQAADVTLTTTMISGGSSQSAGTITSGSTLEVLSGGTAVGFTILSGGSAVVSGGGIDSGTTIGQGATETVLGSATGDQVEGSQIVSAGTATVSGETIYNGGTVDLAIAGAVASGLTVDSGGTLEVGTGAMAQGIVVSGGSIAIGTGGTAQNIIISGGVVALQAAAAVLSSVTFAGGGTIDLEGVTNVQGVISGFGVGDVIDEALIGSGATLSTSVAGGNTDATIISGGVSEAFTFAGSIAAELTLTSDGLGGEELTFVSNTVGVTSVTSGATQSGFTVSGGATLDVLSGGTALSATILSGGSEVVAAGGVDSGSTIESGGTATIIGAVFNDLISGAAIIDGTDSGSTILAGGNETISGSASGDQIYGTQLVSNGTAVVSNETVFNGGALDLYLKGAVASAVTVESGGSLNISGNATAEGVIISGGVVDLQSPKAVLSGSLTFDGAGTIEVTDTTSAGYGDLAVISGFGVGDVIDETVISAGATLTSSTVSGNTVETITSGTTSASFIFAGAVSATLMLTSDGHGGVEIIAVPPPTSSTVSSGTTQSGTTVTSGSEITVALGGKVVTDTVLSGGSIVVSSGGVDSGSIISNGGSELVLGSASQDQIYGTQMLSAATAVVTSETVYGGGALDLNLAGAVASSVTVDSGGSLNINGHAVAESVVISGGVVDLESAKAVLSGSLTFDGAGTIEVTAVTSSGYGGLAVISGFSSGDVIDETLIGSGATMTPTTVSGNTVETITSGGVSASFIFAGVSSAALTLISDGHGGVEIVSGTYVPPVTSTVSGGTTQSGTTVTSGSIITVASGGTVVGDTVQSGGSIVVQSGGVDSGSIISNGGMELVLGSASQDQIYGTQILSAATAVVTSETVYSGGALDLNLKGAIASAVTVDAGGSLNISGNATAENFVINGGVVDLQSPKAVLSGSLTFDGAGTIEVTAVTSAGYGGLAVISGFGSGDVIDETVIGTGATLSSSTSGGNTVETITSGGNSASFIFAGTSYGSGFFNLGPDSGTGVELTTGTPCYCRGTLILTDQGEVPVEALRIGDQLVTRSGDARPIRWIGRRSYAGRFAAGNREVLPVVIRRGALDDFTPKRDLWVSPLHAMFLDGKLIPAQALVNGASIVQADAVEEVEYFHIELETHDIILAEGAPSETFIDDDSRGMFHNVHEYRALYPEAGRVPARYCAPRIEDGEELEAVCQRILARTRTPASTSSAAHGRLLGHLDCARHDRISGWAQDEAAPSSPVRLRILDNKRVIAEVLADEYRRDLEDAGIGCGRHGFTYAVAGGLSPEIPHLIEVQRVEDGQTLAGAPVTLEAEHTGHVVTPSGQLAPWQSCLDEVTRARIDGWAWDSRKPGEKMRLQVLVNGKPIARIVANRYRAGLADAGIGDGRHAFSLVIPGGLSPLSRHVVQVLGEADGCEIANSPIVIEPVSSFDPALERAVDTAIAALATAGGKTREQAHVLDFLAAQADRLLQLSAETEGKREVRRAHQRFRDWGDRSADPHLRALVVDDDWPVAERDAGSQAILSHMHALQRLGYEISFIAAQQMASEGNEAAALEGENIAVCRAPFYASVEEVLRRQAGCFDVIYLHRISNASKYMALARQYFPRARILYSVADLHHVRLARQADIEGRPELRAQSARLRLAEYTAALSADAVVTHSPVEAAWLRQAVPDASVHVVPWAIPVRQAETDWTKRCGVGFIGNFAHTPNVDAAHYLVEEVMPLVWRHDPGIECLLVGSQMPDAVMNLARPGVRPVGHVPDLSTILDRVRLSVAPLRYGAGVKGKVLASFAAGIPCVMSPIAAEGIDLPATLGCFVGATPAELAERIVLLHSHAPSWRDAAEAGLSFIRAGFTTDHIVLALKTAIDGRGPVAHLREAASA